jgi:hypothetical protein
MSENWITLIPKDPRYIPPPASQERARLRFLEIAPDADEARIEVGEKIVFFDCGANLERIACPSCGSEISKEWWQEKMEEDYDRGFQLAKYPLPCCGAAGTLDELIYEWPQGFARFALDAMNPNIGLLDDEHKREFEEILATPLRVIYQHM